MKNKKVIIILISILLIVVLCLLLFYLKDGLEPKLYNKDDKKVRMIKLNDKLYYDTGIELYNTPTCGTPDVIITKRVNEKEEPLLNGESNFGTDIYIQYNGKDILNVNIDSKWIIFSSKEIKREKLEIPHKIDVDINKNMDIKKYSINIDNIKFKNVVDEYLYDYKDEYRLLIDEIKTKYNDFDEKRYKLNINIYSDNNDGIIKLNYMIGEILTNKSIVFNVLGGKVISVLYINMDEYVNVLNEMADTNYSVVVIFITDIIKNGSYVIYNTKASEVIEEAFGLKDTYEGVFLPKMVSRKKQILPSILSVMEDKK